MLWVEKYRPKSFDEVVNQEEAKEVLASWICHKFKAPREFCSKWAKKRSVEAKAILLAGPPGTGKTTLVHALAREINYELIELNASDVRTGERVKQTVGRGIREVSLFGYVGRMILFDEVDGLHAREDAGGLEAVIEIIETAKIPVVMTANNPYDSKFRPLREISHVVNLRELSEKEVVAVLMKICKTERAQCEEEALAAIAKSTAGDLRAAINDLQMYLTGDRVLTLDKIRRDERNPQMSMFKVLDKVYKARWFSEAVKVSSSPSFDWEQYFTWVLETIPTVYKDLELLAEAYDNLSKADMFIGVVKKTQEWELLRYALELVTGGVSQVRNKPRLPPFIKYGFPQRFLTMSRLREVRKRRELLARYLSTSLHVSRSVVNTELVYVLSALVKMGQEKIVLDKLSKALGVNTLDIRDLLTK